MRRGPLPRLPARLGRAVAPEGRARPRRLTLPGARRLRAGPHPARRGGRGAPAAGGGARRGRRNGRGRWPGAQLLRRARGGRGAARRQAEGGSAPPEGSRAAVGSALSPARRGPPPRRVRSVRAGQLRWKRPWLRVGRPGAPGTAPGPPAVSEGLRGGGCGRCERSPVPVRCLPARIRVFRRRDEPPEQPAALWPSARACELPAPGTSAPSALAAHLVPPVRPLSSCGE